MGKRTHHGSLYTNNSFLENTDIKTIAAILAVELGMLLLVMYKGLGNYYLPVTLILMGFTTLGCAVAFHFHADHYLLIIVLVLLNLGFMVQQIQVGKDMQVKSFLAKFIVAISVAFAVSFIYKYIASLIAKEFMIMIMIIAQYVICLAMLVLGKTVGDLSNQGATIMLFGITPFELVKISYIFIAVGLLCKDEFNDFSIVKFNIQREIILVIHTAVLSIFFLLCNELGTLLVVYCSGLVLLWIYGKNRKAIISLVLFSIIGFAAVWFLCDMVLYPLIASGQLSVPSVVVKLIKRFGTALHPERAISAAGFQGTLGLEAIAMGEWFGIGTERHRLLLPKATNDFVFANVVQTCGLMMGFIMLLFFFAFLRRGIDIASQCEDIYFQGTAMGITIVIIVETIIHIGYNNALFPITGIPLYFVSQGFTAIITGMALVSMLLVVSTGNAERSLW